MRRTAERPHEKYLRALADYKDLPIDEWATHFPPGYRERVAPTWLGEVYSTGTTGKLYAKEFVRARCLGDCSEARELIPILCAIDCMLLQDQIPGAINAIALEKLAKRGYGIICAFRECERKEDWKKPGDTKKGWKTKVNHELWRRIDPEKGGADETAFTNRRLEEEIRGEVDRDAAMLKAFSKRQERSRPTPE